ncbi:MAG: plasmid mobilization protein [Dysosmobacter sp.]
MQNGRFLSPPRNRASAGNPAKRFRRDRTSDRERVLPLAAGRGFVVRSDGSQHRICLVCGEAAALPNALGGAWPHTPKLRAEAHTHSKLRAFLRKRFYPPPAAQLQRGTSPPLRNPQLSEGTRKIILERSLIMKKDIKFSTRMVSTDREKIRALAAKAHMSMSDYVTACCLGKRIVVIDEQKELLRQLKGIGSNINRLTVLANMGKVQVIGLDKAARNCLRSAPLCGQSWKGGEPYGHRTFCELQAGQPVPCRHARRDALRHAGEENRMGRMGRSSAASTANRRASTTIS